MTRASTLECMTVYIDPPLWPAHGTLWSHLVSDVGYDELHEFAAHLGVPRRGFDLDHYDVPASLYVPAIKLGALAVDARDVVHLLRDSGLRVRGADRDAERPKRRRQYLEHEWASLAPLSGMPQSAHHLARWELVGQDVLGRWNEAHRSYHDERHLEDVLLSLNQLATRGERITVATLLAAWFHDAVYEGTTGTDERDSAALAVQVLGSLGLSGAVVQEVGELVVATTPALDIPDAPPALAHLLDADLAIFASGDARYLQYREAVRQEYAHVPDDAFRDGRQTILRAYLEQPTIYRTDTARVLWEARARVNLTREIEVLVSGRE